MNLPCLAASQNAAVSGLATGAGYFLLRSSHALQNGSRGGVADAQETAGAVGDGEIAIPDLHLRMRLAAQLPDRLEDLGHAAAVDGVVAAEAAAVGVERQLADAGDQIAVGDELAALALLAEAEVLELHQDRDGEAVVDRGVFDVLRRDAGFLERARTGPDAGGVREIEILAAARALHRLAMADQPHQRLLQALGNLGRRYDQRAAAIGDDAAVEPMQGIRDHRGIDHILDGDDVLEHRVRIVLRVMRGRDLDPGELLAGGAIVVHVTHGAHAIGIVGGRTIGCLEVGLGARRTRRRRAGARLAGQRDQRDRALARRDRLRRVAEMDDVGAAAGVGAVYMAQIEAEIIDHRPGTARRVTGAEVAVDVVLGEPGILDRAFGDLGVKLGCGFVRRMPGRMFVDPGNVGLALDGQIRSPLAVLWPAEAMLGRHGGDTGATRRAASRMSSRRWPCARSGRERSSPWNW